MDAIKNPEEPTRGALTMVADEDVALAPELTTVPVFEPVAEAPVAVAEADEAV